MTKALAVGLGLPDDYFVDKCSPPMSILAFWHYLPYPTDTDSWGVGPHTDSGMWTFLLQDDIGGLEVEITEGQWVEVKPIPGSVHCSLYLIYENITNLPATDGMHLRSDGIGSRYTGHIAVAQQPFIRRLLPDI